MKRNTAILKQYLIAIIFTTIVIVSTNAFAQVPIYFSLKYKKHVIVRSEPGRQLGWPANGGIWNWGDEILVMYDNAAFFNHRKNSHDIDKTKPRTIDCSRSMDGGLSWSHKTSVIPNPEYENMNSKQLKMPIDLTDPNTIIHFQNTRHDTGYAYLFYPQDRGQTWKGAYALPDFGMGVVSMRNDFIIENKNSVTAFWSMSELEASEHMTLQTIPYEPGI